MRTFTNRVIGLVLALAMIAAFVLVPMPTDIKANAATVNSTNLVSNIQDGVTLQCWNWSIANIKANLGLIANMGYSAIQVSPMQEMKEGTVNKPVNNWWAIYQPISFYINESQSHCVGTKDELIDLCNEAHKYGIKVIMDVVFNHTANNGANQLCPMVDPDFLNDPACWHDYSQNSSSYNDRYDVTQRCMAGLPDLNTGNQKVQDKALALMKEYVDCGVDGFRFDAAKQIETPEDHSSYASDFWPTVVNGTTSYAQSTRGITPYYYGELLQDTDNYGSLPISAYTKYMSATESVWSNDIRYKMEEHNASALQTSYFKDAPADKLVLWAESHDTIGDLSSVYSSDYVRNKAWALAASRAYTMALYFPRSNYMTNIDPNANDRIYQEMGELAKLGWSSEFTKQVNYFHNHFAGQSEYMTRDTSANLYYVERGNSGVMITNFNDGGRDINLPVYAMASGTYYDQLTGNMFTVSNGRITGQMGDTGVAVVYNPSTKSCSHSSHGADGYCYSCFAYVGHSSGSTCSTCGTASTRTIYFINNESWSTPYIYGWHDSAGEATASWPGNKMTYVEGSIWSATVPTTATNIIFNDGAGNQTVNLVPSASDDTYDNEFGTWSTRGEVVVADNYYLFYTTNSDAYNGYDYRFVDGKLTMTFAETSYIWLIDSNGVQYMTDGWLGAVTSAQMKTLNSMTDTPNKLPVPAGVALTFTMTHNTDGSITLSYAEADGSESGGNTGGNTGGGTTTSTTTIYFDATSSGWSNVNVYSWTGNTPCTGEWPGSAMTKVSGNIYSYKVPTGATNIIFNNGSSQTSDLTIPTDGKNLYNGSAWSTYSAGGNSGGSTGGDVTGGSAPDNTYYLFWGNSTGSLNHNEWDTCFMSGKVTVTFAEDMYVWVITNVDGTQYMTEGWQGQVNSVTLYRQPLLSNPNKLYVPAGTHTLTLNANSDGSLTLAYGDGNSGNTGGSTGGDSGNQGGTTTTTTTIYFDATSSGWSNVNVYTWDANNTPYTGEWPGSAMTKVSGNIYSYNVPTGATKIIFNNGSSQTSDLTIPTDGKNQYDGSSWSVYGSSSGGDNGGNEGGSTGGDVTGGSARDNTWYLFWGNSTGSLNHNEWDTCFMSGKVTVTFAETMYVWVITNEGGIQYMTEGWQGTVNSVTLYPQPQLSNPNKLVIPAGTHTLTLSENSDGSLTLAYGEGNADNTGGSSGGEGGSTVAPDYYLVGYINGADYGCEDDYENLGIYKFVDGKLTTSFDTDSYIFVKTGDNNKWMLAESYCTDTTCTFKEGGSEKMFVPGGVELTFTLTENDDGSVTISYVEAGGDTSCTHSYTSKVTTAATCTTAGVKTYTCSKCGDSYTESIAATGHNYVAGSCTSCGAVDPNASTTTSGYVLVTDINDILSGGKFIIAVNNNGTYRALGSTVSGTNIAAVDVTVSGNTASGADPITMRAADGGVIITKDGVDVTFAGTSGTLAIAQGTNGFTVTSKDIPDYGILYHKGNDVFTITLKSFGSMSTYINEALFFKYTETTTEVCAHSYTSKVTTAATCTTAGVKTYTCSKCSASYTEAIAALGHNYANGTCTTCGAADPNYVVPGSTVYYLIGWINGADHGCESDWENMGNYKFEGGKLTAKFDSDSYVFLKTEGNGKWLLTEAYTEDTTATFVEGGSEKMFVPGNVEVTFTLTENADGSVTLSYAEGGSDDPVVTPSTVPTLTLKAPTLEFKDMITVNAMFTAENIEDVVEMGMITYTSQVSSWSVDTAAHVIPGTTYDSTTSRYIACSQGIHAKYLGDKVYLAVYAKLADGTYAYSKLASYSPVQYATSKLSGTDASLKQLVVAMLNYGAAAQTHFGHNTSALANASLTAEQKALPAAYSSSMVSSVPSASAVKQGAFANNSGFAKKYPSISFEGAFCINYFFTPNYTPDNGITLYYWNAADYNAASVLTTGNASGSIKLSGSGTGEYSGDIEGIAAKALSEAVYVAAVYTNGGTTWTSGVLGYSIGAYCSSQATKGGTIAELAKATAVYGYHAKAYFG